MARLGLELQPTGRGPERSHVAPDTWGLLMLRRLLIGLARLDLQIFAVGHSTGVAVQITPFWTVLITLPPASCSGTHRPPTVPVVCRSTGRLQAEHTGRDSRKESH